MTAHLLRSTRALVDVDGQEWREQAACRDHPVDVFFPFVAIGRLQSAASQPAKAICAFCPVRRECGEYALANRELLGVWGGMTENERKRERDARARGRTLFFSTAAGPEEIEPPARQREIAERQKLLQTLEHLAATHPGRWGIVARFAGPKAATVRAAQYRGGYRPAPAGRWEFEGHRESDGGSVLYARFLGAEIVDGEEATGA